MNELPEDFKRHMAENKQKSLERCARVKKVRTKGGRGMNDTTFSGNGKVSYIPVITNTTPKPMSNGDEIRSMSDYDLADWIANILMCHGAFARSEDFDFDRYCADCPLDKCCNDQPSDNIEDWLKSPADKEEE